MRARNIRTFLKARFAGHRYLGLHLTVGFLATVFGLWLFAGVTEDVINRDPITAFDITLLEWLHAHNTPAGIQVFEFITALGSPVAIGSIGVIVGLMLARRKKGLLLAGWVATLGGSPMINRVLKIAVQRSRPQYALPFLHGFSYSFPSGHAMGSLVAYGMIAYILVLYWAEQPFARFALISGAALLTLAIGFSRLYLGVHFFTDVIGGYAAGIIWLSICITGLEIARRRPRTE